MCAQWRHVFPCWLTGWLCSRETTGVWSWSTSTATSSPAGTTPTFLMWLVKTPALVLVAPLLRMYLTAWLHLILQTILTTSGKSSELNSLASEGILKALGGETWQSVKISKRFFFVFTLGVVTPLVLKVLVALQVNPFQCVFHAQVPSGFRGCVQVSQPHPGASATRLEGWRLGWRTTKELHASVQGSGESKCSDGAVHSRESLFNSVLSHWDTESLTVPGPGWVEFQASQWGADPPRVGSEPLQDGPETSWP